MVSYKIAGIGEILFDILGESEEIGGAPINFAYHASALGAVGIAISSVGNDRRGRKAIDELKKIQEESHQLIKLIDKELGEE